MRTACVVLGLAWGLSIASACDSGGTECTCPPTGLTLSVPSGLTATAITGSEPACMGAKSMCVSNEGGQCSLFRVLPVAAGACHLDVDFTDGTVFSDDLTVVSTSGCCGGFRADPPSAAEIDVPAPDDAGPDGND